MRPQRVVFLDDDEDLRDAFADLVADAGAGSCLGLGSYDQLLAARAEVLRCDRAILDVNLGSSVPSGIDAYRWLRRQGFAGPIVFLTGHAGSHPLVADALRIGDARVLAKPASVKALEAALAWNGRGDT